MTAFRIVHSADQWCEKFADRRAVLTVGNFDGVHLGHQRILRHVREQTAKGDVAAVLTFYPHPTRVLRPDKAPPLL